MDEQTLVFFHKSFHISFSMCLVFVAEDRFALYNRIPNYRHTTLIHLFTAGKFAGLFLCFVVAQVDWVSRVHELYTIRRLPNQPDEYIIISSGCVTDCFIAN